VRSPRRCGLGVYGLVIAVIVGAASICSLIVGRTYAEIESQRAPFGRMADIPSFDPVANVTLGLPPGSSNLTLNTPKRSIRAIVLYPQQIILFAGGQALRIINTPRPVATLDRLVKTVRNPDWLQITRPGQVTARAAIVVQAPISFSVKAPTKELVLKNRKGVFLAAYGNRKSGRAKLTISHVMVRASDNNVPRAGSRLAVRKDLGRPFVYANHSDLHIRYSSFRWLGRDWNGSYGVAWSGGSSGYAVHSLFESNFIGAYSDRAKGLTVNDNVFRYNSLYGIDPHSYSTNVSVQRNISEGNGRHGIIFSDHVSNGVVRDNVVRNNSLNGIMMDAGSTGNVIERNRVEHNHSDGIVLADSGSNTVRRNLVKANRVGIHVRGATSTNQVIRGNTVTGNLSAGQGTELVGNRLVDNGGHWKPSVLWNLWLGASVFAVGLFAITGLSRRQTRRLRPSTQIRVTE
jgi:poly(beta-D-mannuronate) C5 epimerase